MSRLAICKSRATTVEVDGRELLYFGGCGYLGLAHDASVAQALIDGVAVFGVSSGASRATSGNAGPHDELERDLVQRFGAQAALLAPEGYTANLCAAQALGEHCDAALIDEHAHPSLIDAALAARLEVTRYPHLDLELVRDRLRDAGAHRTVVMSDSVFPSRGEIAPVTELVELVERAGAQLVLDDCHATGVLGTTGRGSLELLGRASERVLVTSTFSKALGTYGGFVLGPREWIETARAHAQAYVGTTPIPPALALAGLAALRVGFDSDELVRRMRANADCLRAGLERLGLPVPREHLPVFAFTLESAERMRELHAALLADGILAPYVRYLGDHGAGSFRVVVNAAHTIDEIEKLIDGLERNLRKTS